MGAGSHCPQDSPWCHLLGSTIPGSSHASTLTNDPTYLPISHWNPMAQQPIMAPAAEEVPMVPPVALRVAQEQGGEEQELRSACDSCTRSKIRCEGGMPCPRCKRRGSACMYSEKRRCGPKRKKKPLETKDEPARFEHAQLKPDQNELLHVFICSVNGFLPLTSHCTIRNAMVPLPASQRDDEVEQQRYYARMAVIWGCVAVGAQVVGKSGEADMYIKLSRTALKDCFDATLPELVSAYLVQTVFWMHQMDRAKVVRYAGFAGQALRELADPPRDLFYCVQNIGVILCFIQVWRKPPMDAPQPMSSTVDSATQRILCIANWVLQSVHSLLDRADQSSNGSQAMIDPQHLMAPLEEAQALLDMQEGGPSDMALIVIKVLMGYVALCRGKSFDAVVLIEPVTDLVSDNPALLHFPLVWTLSQFVLLVLEQLSRPIAAERLHAVTQPLRSSLAFSRVGSEMASRLLDSCLRLCNPAPTQGITAQLSDNTVGDIGSKSGAQPQQAQVDATMQPEMMQRSQMLLDAQMSSLNSMAPIEGLDDLMEDSGHSTIGPENCGQQVFDVGDARAGFGLRGSLAESSGMHGGAAMQVMDGTM